MKLGEKIGSQMVDHFMPVSNYLREWMVLRGADRRRVTTVHNGVHPLFFKEPDTKFRVVGNYILHVSKWAPKKNTQAIVNALPIIQDAHPYMRLVIVGPGHKEQNYNSEYVKVMGKLPVEWLPQMYAGAKAFVFPSLHETFGIPVAEAMAAGCPVVTTLNCSLPEVAGAAAEYCDHTPRGIARSVIRVLDDPEKQAVMSEDGRERALQFTWEKAARKVLKVYEEVLA